MLTPKINMNGTSAEALQEEYLAAINAVNDAIDAIVHITVHGRDYDQVEPGSLKEAERGHREMIQPLLKLVAELRTVVLDIDKQTKGD